MHDDEIDLFELAKTLWDGKWKISAFVAIAFLIGGGYLLQKDAVYESKLIYSVEIIPPFISEESALSNFKKKFYSVSTFDKWKQNNIDTSLVFEDFSTNEVIDGFIFSKDESKRLANLASIDETQSFVLVTSNQPPILFDFFKYSSHISVLMNNEYISLAKQELKFIEETLKHLNYLDSNLIDTMLSVSRYIYKAENVDKAFTIQRPTFPKKVSPVSSNSIFALCVILGGMVGTMYVLLLDYIRKRKEQMAST